MAKKKSLKSRHSDLTISSRRGPLRWRSSDIGTDRRRRRAIWRSTPGVTAAPAKRARGNRTEEDEGAELANVEGGTLTGHWPRRAAGRTNESSKERVCPRPSTSTLYAVYVVHWTSTIAGLLRRFLPRPVLQLERLTDSESVQGRIHTETDGIPAVK